MIFSPSETVLTPAEYRFRHIGVILVLFLWTTVHVPFPEPAVGISMPDAPQAPLPHPTEAGTQP